MITLEQVVRILEDHSIPFQDFIDAFGELATYNRKQVLVWMGY